MVKTATRAPAKKAGKPTASAKPPAKVVKAKAKPTAAKAATKTKKKASEVVDTEIYAIQRDRVSAVLDEVEKQFDVLSNMIAPRRRNSTGLLCYDYNWGGGLVPGMYQVSGEEHSGKSAGVITIFGHCVRSGIPLNVLRDAEGTMTGDIQWAENLLGLPLGDLAVRKTVRIQQSNVIEDTYDFFKGIMKRFPDKVFDADDDCWYYRADDDKKGQAKIALTGAPSSAIQKRNKKLYVRAPDRIEGIFVVDSYASMVTRADDESDEKSKQAAVEATAFSNNIRRIVAPVAEKGFVVLGVNQIRTNPRAGLYCFEYYTPVLLADGTTEKIGKIVANKKPVEVMSWNKETGILEPKRVVGWHKNGPAARDQWLQVKSGPSGHLVMNVTRNHQVYTPTGKISAEKLKPGDVVYSNMSVPNLSEDQRQVIYGAMLGDGVFEPAYHGFKITWTHALAQKKYFDWKCKMFTGMLGNKWSTSATHAITTAPLYFDGCRKILDKLHSRKHQGETKPRNKAGLSKKLLRLADERAFAVYYMDDGTYYETDGSYRVSFSALRLNLKAREAIAQRMVEIFKLPFTAKGDRFIHLYGKENCRKFHEHIAPYVSIDMTYKLYDPSLAAKKYKWSSNKTATQTLVETVVTSVEPINKKGDKFARYDISVEDNKNYFVGGSTGVLVSNSDPEYEPGGAALKFYSSCRDRIRPMSVNGLGVLPADFFDRSEVKGHRGATQEKSAELKGAMDYYKYGKIQNMKNKYGSPYLSSCYRIWFRDHTGRGRGICLVFDTWQFMKTQGLAKAQGGKKKLLFSKYWPKEGITWLEFKTLILAEVSGKKKRLAAACEDIGLKEPLKLRAKMFARIANGKMKVFQDAAAEKDDNDEEDDDKTTRL